MTVPVPVLLDHRLRVRVNDLPDELHEPLVEALTIPNMERQNAEEQHIWGWQDMPEEIPMYGLSGPPENAILDMPRGFGEDFCAGLRDAGVRFAILDRRAKPAKFRVGQKIELRAHQGPAIAAILGAQQGIYKAPPGSGKTVSVLRAGRRAGTTCIVIVNTKDILRQWVDRIHEWLSPDIHVGRIGDNEFDIGPIWTVATAQTLHSRFDQLEADGFFDQFGFMCLDECFPAGTMISTPGGPRRIESLRVGDHVYGMDHSTGRIGPTEIRHTFERDAESLVDLNGVWMTPNHPVFTQRGYIRADEVVIGDTITFLDATEEAAPTNLRAVRAGLPGVEAKWSLLLEALLDPRSCQQAGQSIQDGRWDHPDEVACYTTRAGVLVPERREWPGAYASAASFADAARQGRLEAGVHLQDRESDARIQSYRWHPVALQDRLGERVEEDRNRAGWRGAQSEGAAGSGSPEDRVAGSSRMDCGARDEQGRVALPVLGGGPHRVYNVETGLGNYFAGGLLVHNCHHATAETYNRIIDRFSSHIRIGVSATPEKTGDFMLAKMVLGPIFHETKHTGLVEAGHLIKPTIIRVKTDFGFNFRGTVSRFQRSNYPQMVEALIRDPRRNTAIIRAIVREQGHHCLVLTKRHEHIDALLSLLAGYGWSDPIHRLTGKETSKDRAYVIDAIEREPGVVFSTIADEALDVPRIDRGFLVFPQKNHGLIAQQVGRFERTHPDKKDSVVYDFADVGVTALRAQWQARRLNVYLPRKFKIVNMSMEDLLHEETA